MLTMTQEQLIRKLYNMAAEEGSQKALAAKLGISEAYLSDVLSQRREPGELVLNALSLERKVVFVARQSKEQGVSA